MFSVPGSRSHFCDITVIRIFKPFSKNSQYPVVGRFLRKALKIEQMLFGKYSQHPVEGCLSENGIKNVKKIKTPSGDDVFYIGVYNYYLISDQII